MELSTNTLVSDHIIKALCNTLMHSLWQGVLLAVAAGIIIVFTKKAGAAYRYNLLIAAMVLFTCGSIFTFLWQLREPQSNTGTYIGHTAIGHTTVGAPVNNIQAIGTPVIRQDAKEGITEMVINYFNTHYNAIVLIWFLIICAKSIQMAVGLHNVFYLKRTKVFAVNKYWEKKLLQLTEQLQIKQAISLLESGIAKAPMVIGHLKPVILIPIGLINSLSAEEVEAILIHELTHIRRRDYLVNLLQSFMEIVFFFNPAVLWISQLIKTERENCCDDLALQQSSDKVSYIKALVSCEEYKSVIPAHVMAFPGSKNNLLDRVKRLAGNRNHSLNVLEKTILAISLVVSGLCVSAFTARENITKALKPVVAVIHHEVNAEHKERAKTVTNNTTATKQEAPMNSTAALLNQQSPTLSPLITHKIDSSRSNGGTLNSALAALAKLDTGNFKKFHEIGRELYREHLITDTSHVNISLNERELIVNGVRMPGQVHERIYRKFGKNGENGRPGIYKNYAARDQAYREKGEQIAYELLKENLVKDKTFFTYKLSGDEFSIDGIKQPDELRRRIVDEFFKPGDDFNICYTFKDPGIYVRSNYSGPGSHSTGAYRSRDWDAYSDSLRNERNRQEAERDKKLVADLLQDGLITDPNNVTFTLNDKAATINGKKQSDEVCKKYKEKYMPANYGSGWNWTYSHHE